jgi:hypothetical protein
MAAVVAVPGCTQSSKSAKPTAHSGGSVKQSQAPTTAAAGLPLGVKAATSIPGRVPNSPGLRRNVDMSTCKAVEGGWSAAGTASNPGSKENVDYTITVFFTTTSATVLDSVQTKVTVKPGDKHTWRASKKFTAPPKTLCVLRGVG